MFVEPGKASAVLLPTKLKYSIFSSRSLGEEAMVRKPLTY
jgi:hypothetical protein